MTADSKGLHASISGGAGLEAAEMKAVFDLAVEAEFMNDVAARRAEFGETADRHPLRRTAAQRRFAAEYAIHMAYVSSPADAQRPEPIVNIVFTAGYAATTLAAHGLVPDPDVFGRDKFADESTGERGQDAPSASRRRLTNTNCSSRIPATCRHGDARPRPACRSIPTRRSVP